MKLMNVVRKYGPQIGAATVTLGSFVLAHADDPTDPAAALTSLGTSISGFAPPLYGLAVAASVILIGVAWIKKGRGAAK